MENLISNAERRGLVTGEKKVLTRVCDLQQAVSAVSGKVELVLEGEQERRCREQTARESPELVG